MHRANSFRSKVRTGSNTVWVVTAAHSDPVSTDKHMLGRIIGCGSRIFLAACLVSALGPPNAIAEDGHPPFASGRLRHGVFSGGFNPTNATRFEEWLGRKSDFNVEFLTDTGYTDHPGVDGKIVTDALSHSGWITNTWTQASRPDRNMMFSVPLSTKQDPSLAHVAQGEYDSSFESIARGIARTYPNAIVRIGWEFNGDWYPWAAKGRADDYVNAFRHVSKIFKAASPNFTIDWCPTQGFSAKSPADVAYPGDDVVDVIGMDVYNDYRWGDFKEDSEKRWEWLRSYTFGLEWQAKFAGAHGKPLSQPEWGVNKDDPIFIEKMHQWMASHNYAYEAYWNSNSAFKGSLSDGQYPHAADAYKRLFGVAKP